MNYIKPKTTMKETVAQSILVGSMQQVINDSTCPVCGKRNGHKGWCPYHKKH